MSIEEKRSQFHLFRIERNVSISLNSEDNETDARAVYKQFAATRLFFPTDS